MLVRRAPIIDAAFLTHAERFPHGRPVPQPLPKAVWISKPEPEVSMEPREGAR